jgi:hypothetical protein
MLSCWHPSAEPKEPYDDDKSSLSTLAVALVSNFQFFMRKHSFWFVVTRVKEKRFGLQDIFNL